MIPLITPPTPSYLKRGGNVIARPPMKGGLLGFGEPQEPCSGGEDLIGGNDYREPAEAFPCRPIEWVAEATLPSVSVTVSIIS